MTCSWRFGIAVCVVSHALLWAQGSAPSEQQQVPSAASAPETPQADESPVTTAEFCTHMKGPDCVTPPRAVFAPYPEYSEEARRASYQGVCVLSLIVGTDGRVHNVKVERALGMGLDEESVKTVERWVFQPAVRGGITVAAVISVQTSFRLKASNISPAMAEVAAGEQQQFTTRLQDGVNWSVSGPACEAGACGTVTERGLYTAPDAVPTAATVIVMAVSTRYPKVKYAASVTIEPRSYKK